MALPEPAPAPEREQTAPQSPSAKRRQSSDDEQPTKRPRISEEPNATSPTTQTSPKVKLEDTPVEKKPSDSNQDLRKSRAQEEKKRGQRLFGGLLSTLSQSTPNGQQKRRQEIEKRQQERAKQQKAEDEIQRARKREDLVATRKAEQIKFDEASVGWINFGLCDRLLIIRIDEDTTYQYVGNGTFAVYDH